MNVGKETEFQENKESLSQLDKGIKSLTAMLNKHGKGSVYFGVADDGDVIGLILGKRSLDTVRERISVLTQPKFFYELNVLTDEESKTYLRLTGKGSDTPYSCDGRYYIRNVASDDQMDNQSLRRALVSGSYDALKETTSPIQQLEFSFLRSYFVSNGIHCRDGNDFLENYGLFNSHGEFNLVAFLLADTNNVSIKVVRFEGTDKSSMSERTEFGNRCLLTACQAVLDYMKSQNPTKVDLTSGIRAETSLFNTESFREAWINAVVHNDWLHMIPPSVFVYDNRIEVSSYGEPPFGMDKAQFFSGRSKPTNKALFDIFSMSDLAEQSGHGVPTIVSNYTESAFNFSSSMIVVTIPFSYTPDRVLARKAYAERVAVLKNSHQQVLNYLLSNPTSSLTKAAESCGLSLGGVKKIVASLKQEGLIRRKGAKSGGEWTR